MPAAFRPHVTSNVMHARTVVVQKFRATLDGFLGEKRISKETNIEFGLSGLKIRITPNGHGAESVYFYSVNSEMLPEHNGEEFEYIMSGPRLGSYSYTSDAREGVSVIHAINKTSIYAKRSEGNISCIILASCDLAQSRYDEYWHQFPKTGTWNIELNFHIPLNKN